MRYRTFGRTGWQVSEIGYGMWGMGGWTGSDDQESMRALDRALSLGCNFFDTAWAYDRDTAKRCWPALRDTKTPRSPPKISSEERGKPGRPNIVETC
jgi:aryl-alcohol dehydrogenase-like predicted oxidoreductase